MLIYPVVEFETSLRVKRTEETNWFAAFDLGATHLALTDREKFLRAICQRFGFDGDRAWKCFAGSGQTGFLSRAGWYASHTGIANADSDVRGRKREAHPPDSSNHRAWLRVWKDLRQSAMQKGREDAVAVLEFYLCSLNGTNTIERWFSLLDMAQKKRPRLICRHANLRQ